MATATWKCLFAFAFLASSSHAQQIRAIGTLDIERAAFSNLYLDESAVDPRDRVSILLSTFDPTPFTSDTSFYIKNIGRYLNDLSLAEVYPIYDDFLWPREPSQNPLDVFGFPTLTQADGFLVPFKNDGSLYVVDMRNDVSPTVYDISYDFFEPYAWFYHRAVWKDVDGDGRKDAIASRTNIDVFSGESYTQLVYFKHPSSPFLTQWEGTLINENIADTFSVLTTLAGTEVLFTVGYFTQKLAVHWSNHPDGLWANPNDIETRIIGEAGKYFDVFVTDVNNDGRDDLLVPINAEVNGTLVVFEIPDDFRTGEFVMHQLAEGFTARSGLGGAGSPGSATTFYSGPSETGKPLILISGDDEGTAYYLRPQSQDPSNWGYDRVTIRDEGEGRIIGKLSVADVDGDGYKEVFLPAYQGNKLHIYTFAP